MIDTYEYSNVEFDNLLSLNDWLREKLAEDCYYTAQALTNASHKTFNEIEADY